MKYVYMYMEYYRVCIWEYVYGIYMEYAYMYMEYVKNMYVGICIWNMYGIRMYVDVYMEYVWNAYIGMCIWNMHRIFLWE